MMDTVIKNARIVTSSRVFEGSIAIADGKIAAVYAGAEAPEAKETIDAEGKYVFPGGIDSHAHLNDPGFTWREDYAHGTAAAAVGGLTTLVDMPLQNVPALGNAKIFADKEKAVSPNAYVDFCFWGGLLKNNVDDLKGMDEMGAVAYKSFIGPVSDDFDTLSIGQAREALQRVKSFGGRAGFHCEDYSIISHEQQKALKEGRDTYRDFLDARPVVAELIATQNIIELARETGAKVHICHVSHPDVAEAIRRAQHEGVDVTAETCSHYLVFTEEDVLHGGNIFKCAPPLRDHAAMNRLWDYVVDGTLCCVGSDHSPCAPEEKSEEKHGVFGAWCGISGVQSVMQVLFSEGVLRRGYSPTLLARALGEGPAKTFGIYGKKGAIAPGFDADLVILDPDMPWEITPDSLYYLNKISAFVGLRGRGLPVCTMVRGKVVAKDGKLVGEKGYGQLVRKLRGE